MSDRMIRHFVAYVMLGALALGVAWEIWAHVFLISMGYQGLESWSWWVRSLVEMMAA